MAKPSLDDLISQVRKEPGPSAAQVAAEKKKKAAKEALKNVPVNKKRPVPNQASQEFVDSAKKGMKAGQKADDVAAKKENLAAKMERRKNLQRKKKELEKKKREGEERKAKVNNALAQATSGPRASSGSSMETGGASADKAAVQSAGQAVSGVAKAVTAATGLDKKMDRMRKNISNRLRPGRKKGLATGAASTGRNNMRPKSSKPADPWKSNKPKDPWKEEFSHWREEFIFEVDDKVPTKKEKTIQPMSGKNTIIINPDSMQEAHKKDHTYLETDMKKRKKNNEKAIADMKKVKDDTVPRWMRENSEFSDWRSEIDEGVGMTVARAIDKTKPPLGRSSIRRSVSSALKMREVDKETRRNRTRKFSGVAASERASKADKYISRSSRTTAKEEFENVDEIYMVTPPKKGDKKDAKKKETWYDRDERKRKERKEEVEHIEEKSIQMQRRVDRYLGRDKAKAKERLSRQNDRKDKKAALAAMEKQYRGMKAGIYSSYEPEGEQLQERPYQVMGYDKEGGKEKKVGKPVKSRKYADARAAELSDTHKATGGKYRSEYTEEFVDEGKNGLWDNIHARRKAGKPKRKPGDKNYPKTLEVEELVTHNISVVEAAFKQYKGKLSQSSKRKSLGRGSSIKDGSKPTGYESKKEFRDSEKKLAPYKEHYELGEGAGAVRYCPKCDKNETRDECKYGGKYWDENSKPAKEQKEHYDWRKELGEGAAWTRKAGKNESGGLNEKGRKSYERENPGSDLKAPSKEPGNKRRSSFCARMKGMKKKLTSSKTANDPNSRINKSLRAWNC